MSRVQPQAPPRPTLIYKEPECVPQPEPERHVSFDEPASLPPPAPASAPATPRGHSIPLPRCRSRTVHSGAVALPPASAVVALDNSPLSSAETLTEAPTEIKRAFSGRLTRVLPWGRSSTMGVTATSLPSAAVSEFGENGEKRPNVTQRGRFAFLKKTRTIDVRIRGGMIFLFGIFVLNLTLSSQLSVRVEAIVDPLPCPCLHMLPLHQMFSHRLIRSHLPGVQTPPALYHRAYLSTLSNPNIAA